ncbi:MAG: zinc-regulated TonB-dependent outer membrane receptor [Myxococcales bacterium]|nr:zinc-regulated TonB-dependent outer membrane receptor [Myxococcales bacterium]
MNLPVPVALACDHDKQPAPGSPTPKVTAEELKALGAAANADAATSRPTAAPRSGTAPAAVTPTRRQRPSTGLMNPNLSLILDTAGAWFSVDKPDQVGAHDPYQTGFNLQQLELHVESAVDPYFELQSNIVFSLFGVEVEEVYARSLSLPGRLQVRTGQFLTAFGRMNSRHPHSWQFADQPLVSGKLLGPEGLRGLGLEVSWLSPLPWFAELTVATQGGKGACCARSFWGGSALPVRSPMDLVHSARLAQFFPIDRDLSVYWGLSGAIGPNPSGYGNQTQLLSSDLYLRYRPAGDPQRRFVAWHTEMMHRQRQVPGDALSDWGMFSELVFRYALRWEVGVRGEYVTGVANDPLDPQWSSDRQRWTGQWTFYPSHFSRLRLQTSVDTAPWRPDPVFAVFVAFEVLVGAHGAHNF